MGASPASNAAGPRAGAPAAGAADRGAESAAALMAAPDYAQWLARGRAHQAQGRAVDAMLCYRRAIRGDPKAPEAQFHLGETLWQLGRLPDEALEAWRAAAQTNGTFPCGAARIGGGPAFARRLHRSTIRSPSKHWRWRLEIFVRGRRAARLRPRWAIPPRWRSLRNSCRRSRSFRLCRRTHPRWRARSSKRPAARCGTTSWRFWRHWRQECRRSFCRPS